MRLTKKVVKVSHSLGIILDKPILKKLNIRKGNFIELNIKKINKEGI